MIKARAISFRLSGVSILALITGLALGLPEIWQPAAVGATVLLAFGMGAFPVLSGFQYTGWIIAAIVAGLIYPSAFLQWGEFDLRHPWLILIIVQLVMFGMGVQMRLKDFAGVATNGRGVLIGLLCQFTIMPLVGFLLTKIFAFEPEIAAGVILIGSCSSGLASNVMVYLARANLPLSVTLTAVATLLAPLMTSMWMKILAGTYIEINFMDMCIQIIKIVIVPIGAAMLFDGLKIATPRGRKAIMIVFAFSAAWLIALPLGLWDLAAAHLTASAMQLVETLSFLLGGAVAGVLYYRIYLWAPKISDLMPYFSMFGIVYFTTVTTAASRDNILQIGLFLLAASILHNTLGYVFGYGISRALRLDRNSARTVALEVGLQNGGMASGLAGVMGKLATLGLAAAIFSPWMNISGSLLGNYWRRRPERRKETTREKTSAVS